MLSSPVIIALTTNDIGGSHGLLFDRFDKSSLHSRPLVSIHLPHVVPHLLAVSTLRTLSPVLVQTNLSGRCRSNQGADTRSASMVHTVAANGNKRIKLTFYIQRRRSAVSMDGTETFQPRFGGTGAAVVAILVDGRLQGYKRGDFFHAFLVQCRR